MDPSTNPETQPTELTETSTNLPSNLLVPRIGLTKKNGETHLPLEEHVLRRPGQPNLHTYTIPSIDCDIHTFIHNLGNTSVSLKQTCFPTHGDCLKVVPAPPNNEVELPLSRSLADNCQGFDILDPQNKQTLLELRFLYAPMPTSLPTGHTLNQNTTVLARMRAMLVQDDT